MSKSIAGSTTKFLYDGLNPVQELDASDAPGANLLTGDQLDEYFGRGDSTGARSYLSDTLGSTIALVDSTGATQTQYTYEPFGNTTIGGSASSNSYQYTGRENEDTKLYFYRSRYYSPTFQRFIAQDPIGFASGDANLYGYVGNDPINNRDPRGRLAIGIVVGAAIGGFEAYKSAQLQGLCGKNLWESVAVGAFFGGLVGAADPSDGLAMLAAEGALAGGYGDLIGQLFGNGFDLSSVGPSEIAGATVGGAVAGALGSMGAGAAADTLASLGVDDPLTIELGQSALGAGAGYYPSIYGGPSGAAIDNMEFPQTGGTGRPGSSCGCSK